MAGSLIRRGEKKWLVRLYLGEQNGKRRYYSKLINGNKKAAAAHLANITTKRDAGQLLEGGRQTVAEFLDSWLDTSVKARLTGRTAGDYADAARLYLKPELGGRLLRTLQPADVRGLYARMSERGLSARSVRKAHAVLHAALEQAVRDRLILQNAAHLAKDALPRRERKERRVLTPIEAGRLVAALDGDELRAYWLLLLTSGLRPAEALALRWADLDGERIRVQRALVERAGKLDFKEPKTEKSRRAVPLPDSTVQALKAHRKAQATLQLRAGDKYQYQDLIFATRTGGPLRQSWLRGRFVELLARAKLEPMRPYDLRHSCATLLLAAGESPKVVAERLGHSSVTLTLDTYSHVLPDMQRAAAGKLERLVFRTPPAHQRPKRGSEAG